MFQTTWGMSAMKAENYDERDSARLPSVPNVLIVHWTTQISSYPSKTRWNIYDYNQVGQYDYVVVGVLIFTLLRDSDQLPRTEIFTWNGSLIFKIKKRFFILCIGREMCFK